MRENCSGIIYKAIGPSGNSYIGQTTKSLRERRAQHWRMANAKRGSGYRHQYTFCCALRKYGIDAFEWIELYSDVPARYLNSMEIMAIEAHDCYRHGYNSTVGGSTSPSLCPMIAEKISIAKMGHTVSQETRDKISKANMGRIKSPEEIKRLSDFWIGKVKSDATRRRMSEGRKGMKFSDEHRAKLSAAKLGKKRSKFSDEHRAKLSVAIKLGKARKREARENE